MNTKVNKLLKASNLEALLKIANDTKATQIRYDATLALILLKTAPPALLSELFTLALNDNDALMLDALASNDNCPADVLTKLDALV